MAGADEALRAVCELGAPPEGTLRVVELPDIVSARGSVMTDGNGCISADLAAAVPLLTGRGAGHAELAMGAGSGGPLVIHHRLLYHGSLAKGTFVRSALLPPRTMVVRAAMRKVEGRCGEDSRPCAARRAGFWAFEVIATSTKPRPARTSKQVIRPAHTGHSPALPGGGWGGSGVRSSQACQGWASFGSV